ncbi:hypothetical protein [Streptomyces pinistramenti]|uniref:hypothetical protein n=1 Tax=Streptomyces pinistramenti TaxID=2884812 RepID=UPI001D076D34|nr:hypothetical protein [Streptomyces pinistramenti]MCB5907109.1 hypothetical protein [Streptomyces pinistramenti]
MSKSPLAAVVLLSAAAVGGCVSPADQDPRGGASASTADDDAWGKGDHEKAMKRLSRAARDPDAELVDDGYAYGKEGLDRTFRTPGERPYRLDIGCEAPGTRELTLRLRRGSTTQEWAVACNDRLPDAFNIPAADQPFTATLHTPGSMTNGLIHWRLSTLGKEDVEDCPDDIEGCDA